jgi:hypothetical protein
MTIETTEQAWTREKSCAIVIVKNASYMESVRLLQNDIAEDDSRAVYLAVGESELFDDSEGNFSMTVPLPLDDDSEYLYGDSLIRAFRLDPAIVITEDFVNYPATTLDDDTIYPLDTMIVESMSGSSVAIAIEAETIEDSIRQLHSKMHTLGRKYLARTLMLAYMDGKRWVITPETTLLALLD